MLSIHRLIGHSEKIESAYAVVLLIELVHILKRGKSEFVFTSRRRSLVTLEAILKYLVYLVKGSAPPPLLHQPPPTSPLPLQGIPCS